MDTVVKSDGDRFADVVENVKLNESLTHVLHYVNDIAENAGRGDVEVHNCLKVLSSMQANTVDAIGGAIE
jgi:hypothetical protein